MLNKSTGETTDLLHNGGELTNVIEDLTNIIEDPELFLAIQALHQSADETFPEESFPEETIPRTSTAKKIAPYVVKSGVICMLAIDAVGENFFGIAKNGSGGFTQVVFPAAASTVSDFSLNVNNTLASIDTLHGDEKNPALPLATWKKVTIGGVVSTAAVNTMVITGYKTYGFIKSSTLIGNPAWLKPVLGTTAAIAAGGTTLLTDIWCLHNLLHSFARGEVKPYKYKIAYALGVPICLGASVFYYAPTGLSVTGSLLSTTSILKRAPSAVSFGGSSLGMTGPIVLETIDDVIDAMVKLVTERKGEFKKFASASIALAISGYLNYYYSTIGENFDKKTFDNDTLLQVTNGFIISYLTILGAAAFYTPINATTNYVCGKVSDFAGSFFLKPPTIDDQEAKQPLLEGPSMRGNKKVPLKVTIVDEAEDTAPKPEEPTQRCIIV